jgi:hypothetical protein
MGLLLAEPTARRVPGSRSISIRNQYFENPGVGGQKLQIRLWVLFLQKKIRAFFAMEKYSLLTGAF